MLETPFILLELTIFIILDLEGLNRIFDIVNVFYILLVLGMIALNGKRQQWYEDELELKLYQYKKRVEVSQRWQDKFAGTWTKFNRVNFYEVLYQIIFFRCAFRSFTMIYFCLVYDI